MSWRSVGDDMDDAFLALQFAGAAQQSGTERGAAEALEDGGPDDQIGDPVSSSIVMKTTPLALPGRCRISTSPAIDRRRSTGRSASRRR